jgi:hypothetical protein
MIAIIAAFRLQVPTENLLGEPTYHEQCQL